MEIKTLGPKKSPSMSIDEKLELCYEIIMQAARAQLLNARGVRTGYTHWLGPELKQEVRIFSGYVSQRALENGTHIGLVLEHYLCIQTELTALISRLLAAGENSEEFVNEVKRLEQVHIVSYPIGKPFLLSWFRIHADHSPDLHSPQSRFNHYPLALIFKPE